MILKRDTQSNLLTQRSDHFENIQSLTCSRWSVVGGRWGQAALSNQFELVASRTNFVPDLQDKVTISMAADSPWFDLHIPTRTETRWEVDDGVVTYPSIGKPGDACLFNRNAFPICDCLSSRGAQYNRISVCTSTCSENDQLTLFTCTIRWVHRNLSQETSSLW